MEAALVGREQGGGAKVFVGRARVLVGVGGAKVFVGGANLCQVTVLIDVQEHQLLLELCICSHQKVVKDMVIPLAWSLAHYPTLLQQIFLYGGTATCVARAAIPPWWHIEHATMLLEQHATTTKRQQCC